MVKCKDSPFKIVIKNLYVDTTMSGIFGDISFNEISSTFTVPAYPDTTPIIVTPDGESALPPVEVSTQGKGNNRYLNLSLYASIKLIYNSGLSHYSDCDSTHRGFDVYRNKIDQLLTNSWLNGLSNERLDVSTNKASNVGQEWWVMDYPSEVQPDPLKSPRWSSDGSAIAQSTHAIYGCHSSRAFAIKVDDHLLATGYTFSDASCAAFNGVWEIEIKCGSNDRNGCETFYLAERDSSLGPHIQHYRDGSGRAPGGDGREIDIFESFWGPCPHGGYFPRDPSTRINCGPCLNLPYGNGTGWLDRNSGLIPAGLWRDNGAGGMPMNDFVRVGVWITGNENGTVTPNDTLCFYAVRPDGINWYTTRKFPKTNSTHTQGLPFVPYIGVWGVGETNMIDPSYQTMYRNFRYVPLNALNGNNPSDNWSDFNSSLNAYHTPNNNNPP